MADADLLSSFSWLGECFLSLLAILALSSLLQRRNKAITQPPSPRRLPLVGNLHQLGSLPHRSLRALAQRHGPVMLLHLGSVPAIIISSAAAAQEIVKTHDVVFAQRPVTSAGSRLFYGGRDILFAEYGDYWRQMRRICVIHLLSAKRVQSFHAVRREEVALLVSRIRAAAGRPTNMSEMIIGFLRDAVCRVVFGKKHFTGEESGGNRIHELFKEIVSVLGTFAVRDYLPRFGWIDRLSGLDARVSKIAKDMDDFLEIVLEEHIERKNSNSSGDCEDFVDILLSLDSADGLSLDRESIKGIMMDMFSGGIDTAFATTDWAMAELIKHPKEMKTLQKELQSAMSENRLSEIGEVAENVEFLQAVIKETLRIHPAAPLIPPRVATEDAELQGYHVPKGTAVFINAWAIGTDPNTWEKAEEFWPERFLQSCNKEQGVDYIPFGGGRRGCPGANFGLATVEIALANLAYHFNWELPGGTTGEEIDMSETFGLAVHRKSSLVLVPKPRDF